MPNDFKPRGLPDMGDPQAQRRVEELAAHMLLSPTHMAIVDYLGMTYQDTDGSLKTVTEATPMAHRYGGRSMQHVEVYGFKVVWKNIAAQRAEAAQ